MGVGFRKAVSCAGSAYGGESARLSGRDPGRAAVECSEVAVAKWGNRIGARYRALAGRDGKSVGA